MPSFWIRAGQGFRNEILGEKWELDRMNIIESLERN